MAFSVWMIVISARYVIGRRTSRRSEPKPVTTFRTAAIHGIDFKNPFTMSKNAGRTPRTGRSRIWLSSYLEKKKLVEPIGIEPMTSSLQS